MQYHLRFCDYQSGDVVTYIGDKGICSGFILEAVLSISPSKQDCCIKYIIEVISDDYLIETIKPSNIIQGL